MRRPWVVFVLGFGWGSFTNLWNASAEEEVSGPADARTNELEGVDADASDSKPSDRFTGWQAPSSCASVEELRAQIEAQIDREPSVIREVAGEMHGGPTGWVATFTVYDQERRLGERQLELSGEDCRSHDETLALVVALLLEHGPPESAVEVALASESSSDAATPNANKKSELDEEPAPIQAQSGREERPLRLRGGIGFGVTWGWLPSPAFGPTTFWGAELLRRASVEVVGAYYLPDESAGFEQATARMFGGRVHLRGCGLPRWGSFGLSACAGFGWMGLSASGRDTAQAESVVHSTPEGSLSVAFEARMGSLLSFEAGLAASAPFRRGRFVFASGAEEVLVHHTAAILLTSHVGVVFTL